MNMDRNTVVGFVLIAVLLFVYLFVASKNSQELQAQNQKIEDSVARVNHFKDSIAHLNDTIEIKTIQAADTIGFKSIGLASSTVVENELIKVTFSNKGGQPSSVELKKYKSFDSSTVKLHQGSTDNFSYAINTGLNQTAQIKDIYFDAPQVVKNADGSQLISFIARGDQGEQIEHEFILHPNSYLIDWTAKFNGTSKLFTQGALNFIWQDQPAQLESDIQYERQQANFGFLQEGDFDYIMTKNEKTFESPLHWVNSSQHFFNTTLIAKNNFNSGSLKVTKATDSTRKIADLTYTLQAKLPQTNAATFPMQIYFGPNDYKILKNSGVQDLDKIVNLGRDMYAFVRPINKFIVMPVFDFFKSFFSSFGWVIALLTIFIRLVTSPLVYSSYLSGAKMKLLKPEIDALKQKYGADQQQFGMEQMKLFREAGVNPLGGCIPALLQIPIFFALYSFFNSEIALRGESFLWADNLASYDAIVHFPINIWGLGSHLSLFTLTAAGTSFLNSLYNANMTPDQNNPMMKYMPYIFPFILLFIFNHLPSALTWYYTVSNVITFLLQFIIQHYIINHDKLLAQLQANRVKPKTKTKWQAKLEEMQEAQKQMQDQRKKSGK